MHTLLLMQVEIKVEVEVKVGPIRMRCAGLPVTRLDGKLPLFWVKAKAPLCPPS